MMIANKYDSITTGLLFSRTHTTKHMELNERTGWNVGEILLRWTMSFIHASITTQLDTLHYSDQTI